MPKKLLVSDESYNSYNLRVLTAGGDFSRFEKNPIMLFNHVRATAKDDILPIGTWENLIVEGTSVFALPVFDVEDEFAVKIAGKYDRGIIKSASISIKVLALQEDELDEDGKMKYTITKWQLMEISITDIPSNANTVLLYDKNEEQIELSADSIAQFSANNSTTTKIEVQMDIKNITGLLGLSAAATDVQVEAKIKELQAENLRLSAAETARQASDVEALVELAVTDGKILPAGKADFIKLATADFDTAKSMLDNMGTVIKLSDVPKKVAEGGNHTGEGKYNGKTFTEWQKDPNGKKVLLELKANDFSAFNDLYKSEFGKDYKV